MTGRELETKARVRLDVSQGRTVVTLLDYQGCAVVTYSVVDKRANPNDPGAARLVMIRGTQHHRRRRWRRRLGSARRLGGYLEGKGSATECQELQPRRQRRERGLGSRRATHHFKAGKPKPRDLDIGTAERLDMNARHTAKGRGAVNAMFFPWDMA